ncbi:metal ABC transporter permease [Tessaracoccus rhinocerotis]|uniref:Metal ABC transporter permease n=1 Tax=Tessaracoccus rhinocerotis TaxID=1689449 RepID=A0A553K281_9ACTN|nr:metal ABC transporter permease [Tessaracoccus rhinocerotis]TRY18817.1 metal ABC transporter permease [Tessaracoccus rhinocerotis]
MNLFEFLGNHTYRMVFLGTAAIGLASGALGAFAYLRKRSLVSDVISHAALPGALGAFLVAVLLGLDGRRLALLLLGALLVSGLAVAASGHIARASKVRVDTAMAIVLTVFFGAGMLLMRVISDGPYPGKGGIQDYLFGNATVITRADLATIVAVAALAIGVMVVFWKEFSLRTFDPAHSAFLGFGRRVDGLMSVALVLAVVIGVKAVGLVLMVALVVTPAAAARQWTRRLPTMVALSALIGAMGGGLGTYVSVNLGAVPPGPVVVLVLFTVFVVSLLLAPGRSVGHRLVQRARVRRALRETA